MVAKVVAKAYWTGIVDIFSFILCNKCGLQVGTWQPLLKLIKVTHFRAFLTEEQREQFGEVVLFFKQNVDPLSKDLAFLLGDKAGREGMCLVK